MHLSIASKLGHFLGMTLERTESAISSSNHLAESAGAACRRFSRYSYAS